MPTLTRRSASAGALAVVLITHWEGYDSVVKPDRLANNLPTGCYGETTYDDPSLKLGMRFSKDECMRHLLRDIPKYAAPLEKCVTVAITKHQWAALTSASYNAGQSAVCHSPMVRAFNAHDPRACDKFIGWRVTAAGKYVRGLDNRRRAESAFCKTPDQD